MGLDDRRQATGRDSGECPKTVTYVVIFRVGAEMVVIFMDFSKEKT